MKRLDYNIFIGLNKNFVKHSGVISNISTDIITVSLKGNMNCEACNAKSACGISESNSKEISIQNPHRSFQLNEEVNVLMQKELGLKAVFWAYVFPFIIMFTMLIISSFFLKEWIAGLMSLIVLIPYYLMLHFFNNSFERTFRISIIKNKE